MEKNNSQFTRLNNDNHLLPTSNRNKIFLDYSNKSDNILQERFTQQTRIENNNSREESNYYYQNNQNNHPQTLFERFPQQTRLNNGRVNSSSYIPNPSSTSYPLTNNTLPEISNIELKRNKVEHIQTRQPNGNHKNPFTLLQGSSRNDPFPDMKPINSRDIDYN